MTKLSVFYSLTHECYRVDYTGRYDHKPGYIDKHNRMHICTIELDKNVTFSERIKILRKNHVPVKKRVSKILFRLSTVIDPPDNNAYKKAPKYPWWKY